MHAGDGRQGAGVLARLMTCMLPWQCIPLYASLDTSAQLSCLSRMFVHYNPLLKELPVDRR